MSRLFKRNNKTTIAELEEYYANQERRKTRAGKAWLMAFVSLLITLAVIAMLFFGGRWLYRTLTDNDSKTAPSSGTSDNDGIDLPTFDGDVVGQGNQSDRDNSANTSDTTENTGVVTDEAASTLIPNTDRVAETGTDSEIEIPNTGAGEVLLALPVVLAITGYLVSRRHMIKSAE